MDDGHIIIRLLEDTVAKYPDYPAVRWIVRSKKPTKTAWNCFIVISVTIIFRYKNTK